MRTPPPARNKACLPGRNLCLTLFPRDPNENSRSVVVTITDRGPHNRKSIIDLPRQAAVELGGARKGLFSLQAGLW